MIESYVPYDPGMSVCLANVNDLIALEGKYNLICLRGFERRIVKIKNGSSVHLAFYGYAMN